MDKALAIKLLGSFAASGVLLASPVAAANSLNEIVVQSGMSQVTKTARVHTYDLNLTSEDGRNKLDQRLRVASGRVCGKDTLWTLRPPADYKRCYSTALQDARGQMDQQLASTNVTRTAGTR